MFAVVLGEPGTADGAVRPMAAALSGLARPALIATDSARGIAAAAAPAGILPEDRFDRQPWVDGALTFVAAGRVDNRDAVFDRLTIPAAERKQIADSRLLLLAYQRWQRDCVQYLSGDFCFCAIHTDRGELIAACDPLGTASLYYALCGKVLVLATQLGSLLQHPDIPATPALDALTLLVLPNVSAGTTAFRDIRMLEGGSRLHFRDGQLSIERWWRPEVRPVRRYRDAGQYLDHARELFGQAVKAQLRAVGGIGVAMSAGLDSTLVAGLAARELRNEGRALTAFTSAPEQGLPCEAQPDFDADESALAAQMTALHSNLQHVVVRPQGRCVLDILPAIHRRSRTSSRNVGNALWFDSIFSAAVAGGSRVVLSGGRGNATLSVGPAAALSGLLHGGRIWTAAQLALGEQRFSGRPAWRTLAQGAVGDWRRRGAAAKAGPRQLRPGAGLLNRACFNDRQDRLFLAPSRPADIGQLLHFATKPAISWRADPMAQWGAELRDPTADRWFIEFFLQLPFELHMAGGRSRGLARELGIGVVPDSIRLRRRRGAQLPEVSSLIALHAGRYRQAVDDMRASTACRERFDFAALLAAIGQFEQGQLRNELAHCVDRAVDVGTLLLELKA